MTSSVTARLTAALASRILVLDGAMGTMVQRLQLTEADFRGERFADHPHDLRGNNDVLVLTRPASIATIHAEYLEAGADIIETNTFSSNAISQADYGLEAVSRELNVAAARLAREAADEWTARTPDRPRFVAGSMGPTTKVLSISPDVNNPALRCGHLRGDARCLPRAGARPDRRRRRRAPARDHCRHAERQGRPGRYRRGLCHARRAGAGDDLGDHHGPQRPHAVGPDARRLLRLGRTRAAVLVGLNCALGAPTCAPTWRSSPASPPCYVTCYPNAGLPNAFGQYDELPEETAALMRDFAESGFVNIIGGCCGTTPDHIRAIARRSPACRPVR
jgi:5-methyltetrahydrofolate--homocysteine methyltransferase